METRNSHTSPNKPIKSLPYTHSQILNVYINMIYVQRNELTHCYVPPFPIPSDPCAQGRHILPQAQRCKQKSGPPGYYRTHTHKQNTHTYTNIRALQGRYFPCTCTDNLCMQIGFSGRSNPLLTFIKTKQRWADTAFWLGGCVFAAM